MTTSLGMTWPFMQPDAMVAPELSPLDELPEAPVPELLPLDELPEPLVPELAPADELPELPPPEPLLDPLAAVPPPPPPLPDALVSPLPEGPWLLLPEPCDCEPAEVEPDCVPEPPAPVSVPEAAHAVAAISGPAAKPKTMYERRFMLGLPRRVVVVVEERVRHGARPGAA